MHEAYYTDTGDIAWRTVPDATTFEPRKHDERDQPVLNRAQRRALAKYIACQARAQVRHVQAKMRKAAKKAEKAQHAQQSI